MKINKYIMKYLNFDLSNVFKTMNIHINQQKSIIYLAINFKTFLHVHGIATCILQISTIEQNIALRVGGLHQNPWQFSCSNI